MPLRQLTPLGQAVPQAPQLLVVVMGVSQPFDATPSQSAYPGSQDAIVHAEFTQPSTA
jgi:hypothetical protein